MEILRLELPGVSFLSCIAAQVILRCSTRHGGWSEMGEMDTGPAFMTGGLNVLLLVGVSYSSSGKLLGGACPLWGTRKVTVALDSRVWSQILIFTGYHRLFLVLSGWWYLPLCGAYWIGSAGASLLCKQVLAVLFLCVLPLRRVAPCWSELCA